MTFKARILLLGTVACAVVAFSASAAQAAGFGVEKFVAANCAKEFEGCGAEKVEVEIVKTAPKLVYWVPKEPGLPETREQGYTQAAGHPPYGTTDFKINTEGTLPNESPAEGKAVKHVRTDVGPGVSTNPEAMGQCSFEEFGAELPGTGFYSEPKCASDTEIGVNRVTVYVGPNGVAPGVSDLPLVGNVYNLVQPPGLASDFGVALPLPKELTEHILSGTPYKGTPAEKAQYYGHTLIEGGVEWAGDYHDYYEINVSTALPLIASRLILYGNRGTTNIGGFITNPSHCVGSGPATTSTVTLESAESKTESRTYTTLLGTEGCEGGGGFKAVPFEPAFRLLPETTQSDLPDGATTELTLPHASGAEEIDSSQLENATIVLPEGMTLNPSGAQDLEACTPAQARIHSHEFGVACPAKSAIGSVILNVPDLPEGSLTGSVYLGAEANSSTGAAMPITGPPYTIYINAESTRYGVDVRLQGAVTTDEATGRVTATFLKNPEQPFSNLKLTFTPGPKAPLANPLVCGTVKSETALVPYIGAAFTATPSAQFAVDSDGKGGACASSLPFALTQSTASSPTTGGSNTSFTLNLGRADGQQYLSNVSAALPAGLVGKIPAVPLCPEPQASLGTCSPASQIGTATAVVGSGSAPVALTGPVYLTGPTGGAPYGMTTAINAAVGPFSLGLDVVRTGIEVNSFTGRVTVAGPVPTIFKGVPLRLKALSVAITTPGFLINPTNCGALATETTLTSSFGATQRLSNPFQATGCSSLAFKPKFTASSNAKTSRANGAALNAKVSYPTGLQSNIKSVLVTVPKQLPSRISTLNKACREATFNQSPYLCPVSSRVGGATVTTPVLPAKLTGPAYFVSHGGAKFPDLDFVMTGNGVTIILVGNTNIQKGITTTNFASLPDVPISSFEENLPTGKNSAVTAIGSICKQSLVMPTTITAQNGKVVKQNTPISVSGCPVTILSHRVSGTKAILTVRAPAAGRVSGSGANLSTVYKRPGKGEKVTLTVPLSSAGRSALAARAPLAVRVRVGFLPKSKGKSSSANVTVLFQ